MSTATKLSLTAMGISNIRNRNTKMGISNIAFFIFFFLTYGKDRSIIKKFKKQHKIIKKKIINTDKIKRKKENIIFTDRILDSERLIVVMIIVIVVVVVVFSRNFLLRKKEDRREIYR